jgi:NAD(P)-dependent dehydrogenase (short-subunit alcohol dehydrogenase family)
MTDGYLARLFTVDGRVALVTGGNSGIGRAIAVALARAGASVVIAGRDEATLAGTVEELGGDARYLSVDLADRTSIARLVAEVPSVDILVNSAGINLRPPLAQLSEVDWDRLLAVNLTAPYLLGQHYGPRMAQQGFGRIITLASQQSERAFGDSGGYGATKAGVTGLVRSQAEAWSRYGVCCNAIGPSFVRTPMTEPAFTLPGRAEAMAARTMIGRNAEPSDYAGVAVFLASAASAYVTGQTIFVDGGFSVH